MSLKKLWKKPAKQNRQLPRPDCPASSALETSHSQPHLGLAVFVSGCLIILASTIPAQAQSNADQARAAKAVVAVARFANDFTGDPLDPHSIPDALGCGVIIAANGRILTNRHLLGDPADNRYFVWLPAGETGAAQCHAAHLLAADPWTDLAVLNFTDIHRGLSGVVLAAGDRTLQTNESVTLYHDPRVIIDSGSATRDEGTAGDLNQAFPNSADRRFSLLADDCLYQFGGLIRIDTAETGYASGGAVIDAEGRLVGLTTGLVPELMTANHIAIPLNNTSVQVTDVVPNSPADLAGIGFADVITMIDRRVAEDANQVLSIIGGRRAGTTLDLEITRGALNQLPVETLNLQIELSKRWIESRRGRFSSRPRPDLQGLQIDFYTAIPNFGAVAGAVDPDGCVVASAVVIDSPAWQAGLRPRQFISHVAGLRVNSPRRFWSAVNNAAGPVVPLVITGDPSGEPVTISLDKGGQ